MGVLGGRTFTPTCAALLSVIVLGACAATAVAVGVTIDYATWISNAVTMTGERQVIAAFEATHPDIKVNLISVPSYGEYNAKLISMMIGGSAPDIVLVDAFWYHDWVEKDLLMDLTDWVAKDMDKRETLPAVWEENTVKGRLYAAANLRAGHAVTYYDRDKFLEFGVPTPHQRKWDREDYTIALRTMTRDTNGDGKPDYYGSQRIGGLPITRVRVYARCICCRC